MRNAIFVATLLVTAGLGLLAADSASAAPVGCTDKPEPNDTHTRCDAGSCFVDYEPFRPSGVGCSSPCFVVSLHGGEYICA